MDQISAACWESAKEALSSNSCRKHFHFFRDQLLLNHFLKSWYIANWTHTHTHLPVTRWRSIIADELICSCTCGGQADIVLYCSVCFCFELGSLPIGVAQWASESAFLYLSSPEITNVHCITWVLGIWTQDPTLTQQYTFVYWTTFSSCAVGLYSCCTTLNFTVKNEDN